MKYKKGQIVNLKLEKKILGDKLLIFDLDDYSGWLRISNISNDLSLCQKMFDLIVVGQEVTCVILGFNEEKKYYELSTKSFRNDLADILSFTKCKKIVTKEYNDQLNDRERIKTQNRRILDRLRGDLSSKGLTFLYELLQNAVDHPNNNFNKELSVHFDVFENFLLLKHNGALFTEDNFKSITGILYGEQNDLNKDNKRIGYKGIGFKSVFRHTNNVYLRSGNFSFSFTEKTGSTLPWEVIPIFQNEIEKIDEIKQFDFFNAPVAFAFEFPNKKAKEDVINYLEKLAKNSYLLMFLDNLISLKITLPDKEYDFEKEVINENKIDLIALNTNNEISKWLKFSNEHIITENEIINELNDLTNKSIPENFRNFRTPKVEILIPEEPKEELINLFAYLPLSETQFQLPYIVNADFIPNLDRGNIISDQKYNNKLSEFVAEDLLKACVKLAKNKQYDYLKLLIPNFFDTNNDYKNILRENFIANVNNYSFFPSLYNGNLTTLKNLIIDETGIFNLLTEDEYNAILDIKGVPLNKDFGNTKELVFLIEQTKLGQFFTIDDLKSKLRTEKFIAWLKHPLNNIKFIEFVFNNESLKEILKEAIFLTNNNDLKKASNIFLDLDEKISDFGIEIIHPRVKDNLEFFDKLSFKKYNFKDFFDINIKPNNDIDNNEQIKQWHWIYDEWENLKIDNEIISELNNKKILTKNNEQLKVEKCFVPKEYDLDYSLEEVLSKFNTTNLNYISETFISENRTTKKWTSIFKKLNAKTNLQDVISDIISNLANIDKKTHFQVGQEIFKYWQKHKGTEAELTVNQLEDVEKNLLILCKNDEFIKTDDTIISDYYNTYKIIESILPLIDLPNTIVKHYAKKRNNRNDWNEFFNIIGCKTLKERQDVLTEKMNYFILNQDKKDEKSHFEFLESISNLYSNSYDNNISFKSIELSKIKLLNSNNEWVLPSDIHFSSVYKPALDLQKDTDVSNVYFLNERYQKDKIKRTLLKKMGVNETFTFELNEESIKLYDLKDEKLINKLWHNPSFSIRKDKLLRQNYALTAIKDRTNVRNIVSSKYLIYSLEKKYNNEFWDKLIENSSLVGNNIDIINYFIYPTEENEIVNFLKNNKVLENKSNELKSTSDLYSLKFEKYLSKEFLPNRDFTNVFIDEGNTESLEEFIGINQRLSIMKCIEILSQENISLTKEDVSFLEIVEILATIENEDIEDLKLPNQNYEWCTISKLHYVNDNIINIDKHFLLHNDFKELKDILKINKISKEKLSLSLLPEEPTVNDELNEFFKSKTRYISYKIDNNNWKELDEEFNDRINKLNFYQVDEIRKEYSEDISLYSEKITFFTENFCIYYCDFWKSNKELIQYLWEFIFDNKIPFPWFNNIINKWNDEEINKNLLDEYGTTPWLIEKSTELVKEKRTNSFFEEVQDYINTDLREVEDIYDDDRVIELQSLLQSFVGHPKEKQLTLNLLAKLKVCKQLELNYNNNWEFNQVNNGEENLFVHSAKGAFAYIHPKEIIKMRDEEYRMAIDYGKGDIRIYDTAEEIINLYSNYLMLYQTPKDIDKIFAICEESQNRESFHFLIVDQERQTEENEFILKLINSNSYE